MKMQILLELKGTRIKSFFSKKVEIQIVVFRLDALRKKKGTSIDSLGVDMPCWFIFIGSYCKDEFNWFEDWIPYEYR